MFSTRRLLSTLMVLCLLVTSFAFAFASAEEKIELTYTGWGSPDERKVTQAAIDSFMAAHPNIHVNYIHIPDSAGSYDMKLTTMMAAGQAPDAALFHGDLGLQWAQEGKIANIMDYLNGDPEMSPDDILPQAFYWWDEGKCIGMNGAIEAFALFYNKKIFDEAGVAYPPTKADEAWTYEQFVDAALKLTIDNNGKNAMDPAFDPSNIRQFGVKLEFWSYMQFVYGNGGSFLSEDGNEFALTSPEALEGIQKMADLVNKYHVAPSKAQEKNIPGGATALMSKKVAMIYTGQWALLDIGMMKDLDFGIGVAPKLAKNVTMTLGDPLVMFASTKHPKETYELLKWFWNPENTLELQTSGLWMPILKKWYTDPELVSKWATGNRAHPEGYIDAVLNNAFENGVPTPGYSVRNLPKINALLEPALDKVWLGLETAEQAIGAVAPQIQGEVKGLIPRP